jgi:thiosulfate dehydrogenase (quinone) large subunit
LIRKNFASFMRYIEQELHKESVYLVPLRLFIGVGWIRASLEKLVSGSWMNGSALKEFFNQQLASGLVVFPFYKRLITTVFAPNALTMSWVILVGQMLVGLAILLGFLTNFALIWGLFMNLNFILAGRVNPSAFYIVIQVALLVANAGAVLGLDRLLSRRLQFCLMTAQCGTVNRLWRLERVCFFLSAIVAMITGLSVIPFIHDFGPTSIDDPAMLLLVMSVVTGMTVLITAVRLRPRVVVYKMPEQTRPSRKLQMERSES